MDHLGLGSLNLDQDQARSTLIYMHLKSFGQGAGECLAAGTCTMAGLKIVALAGSFRKASTNLGLLRAGENLTSPTRGNACEVLLRSWIQWLCV